MVVLPRLARALNQPLIAGFLGIALVAVAIVGMATDEISTRFGVIILVIGAINMIRTFARVGRSTEE